MQSQSETTSYESILYPLPYRQGALQRASGFNADNPRLGKLYQNLFSPQFLRLPPIEVPLPFYSQTNDQEQAQTFFDYDPQLPLSIVTVTRNDDHVERMDERTQAFIDCLYYLAEKYQRRVELIIVEWNPPSDRPPLAESFRFPADHAWMSTAIVTVSADIHNSYELADRLPLYQMIGKNVGIRRARGEFILSTNIDVLLSETLFDYITGSNLKKGHCYRGNRWDVDRRILDLDSPQAMIDSANELTFQINYPHATVPVGSSVPEKVLLQDMLGYQALPDLHTMACGDFQLLHRDDWAKVRGYCELDTFSFHLDSLFCVTCYHAGLEEIDMRDSRPHFHIDHTLGTSVQGDSYVIENTKVMKHISLAGLINLSRNMEEAGDFYVLNKTNWGLAGIDLPTNRVTSAEWETPYSRPTTVSDDAGKGALDCLTLATVNISDRQFQQQHDLIDQVATELSRYIKLNSVGREVVIWGTGQRARVFREFLARHGIAINTLVDSHASETHQLEDGTTILNQEALQGDTRYFVVIFSMYADDIRHQLDQLNYSEGNDYLVGF